jgi:hypothetical protein
MTMAASSIDHVAPTLSQSPWPVAVSFLFLIVVMLVMVLLSFFSGRWIVDGLRGPEGKKPKEGRPR